MTEEERLALLALSLVPGLGPVRVRALRAHFGSARRAVEASGAWPPLRGLRHEAVVAAPSLREAQREVERAQRVGAWCLDDADPRFPEHWRHFDDLPPLLWVRGAWPAGLRPHPPTAVAVVGSRRAPDAALDFALDVGRRLARAGAVVVSGLAYGVDAAAHRGALAAGPGAGATLAVLASGVDRPSPSGNARLARAILEGGGALVSERALGSVPGRGDFPRRNRLIAALARSVLVVAAGAASGAQLTAGHAARYGCDVVVCPACPWNEDLSGNLALLRDGAAPLVSAADAPWQLGVAPVGNVESGDEPSAALPCDLAWAWHALSATPAPLEALVVRGGRGVGETLASLERLVAAGLCEVDGARRYRRC